MFKRFLTLALTFMVMLGGAKAATADDVVFSLGDVTTNAGMTNVKIPISITNPELVLKGFSFDVTLPEGVTLQKTIEKTSRMSDHDLTFSNSGNVYSCAVASLKGNTLAGTSGEVMSLLVNIDSEIAAGDYTISLTNITVSYGNNQSLTVNNAENATLTVNDALVIEDFQFYTKDIVVESGATSATLEVLLNNSQMVYSFSVNLILPENISVATKTSFGKTTLDVKKSARLNGSLTATAIEGKNGINITYDAEEEEEKVIIVGDEKVFSVNLKLACKPGSYNVSLLNQSVVKLTEDYDFVTVSPAPSDFASTIKLNGTEEITLTVNESKWATLVLPYAAETPAGLTAYTATGAANGVVTLEEQSNIPAMTPVIIYGAPGTYSFSGDNSAAKKAQYKAGVLEGTLVAKDYSDGYVMQTHEGKGTGFYQLTTTRTVPAYRCVLFPESSKAHAPRFMLTDDVTGIDAVNSSADNAIYTIDGRKVNQMTKGAAYIVNGTKVIIK